MDYKAFTKQENTRADRLITEISVRNGEDGKTALGQWDTGASGTCISTQVVETLKLIPVGRKSIMTPSGGDVVKTYVVDIVLPNNVIIFGVPVMEAAIGDQGIGVLIGMDIISMGDFAVTTNGGKTTFSFVMPSIGTIDFIPKSTALNKIAKSHRRKKKN